MRWMLFNWHFKAVFRHFRWVTISVFTHPLVMIYTFSPELWFAPAGTTIWAQGGGWFYPTLACHTFEQTFITVGLWQAAIKHKAPRQEAHSVAANVIIPNHSLRLLRTISELICWAINQSGKLQRRNSLFCEPSRNSPTPTQSLRAYTPSRARRSQGFDSKHSSAAAGPGFFWKHLGSKRNTKLFLTP